MYKMLGRCSIAVMVLGLKTEKWKEFSNTTDTDFFQFLLLLFASSLFCLSHFHILSFSHVIYYLPRTCDFSAMYIYFCITLFRKRLCFFCSSTLFCLHLMIITPFCITKYHVILFIISLY